jgi:hypothetical protein
LIPIWNGAANSQLSAKISQYTSFISTGERKVFEALKLVASLTFDFVFTDQAIS